MKNIGYHTRLYSDNTKKIVGGSFGGSIDQQTVERLVKSHFTVVVKPSGTAVFVDRDGREVSLYFSIDASTTEKGREALVVYRKEKEKSDRLAEESEIERERVLRELTDDLTIEQIKEILGKA